MYVCVCVCVCIWMRVGGVGEWECVSVRLWLWVCVSQKVRRCITQNDGNYGKQWLESGYWRRQKICPVTFEVDGVGDV